MRAWTARILAVRPAHEHLPVKPAGPQQGGVQDIRPVGGRQDHHALVAGEAVHLHQQLVEGLLPLVVSAAQARAPLAAHGVDLVDEHNRRGGLFRLVKEVPDPAGAHAHVELHEVRAGDGEELHPRLPGHGLGQQGLAGARRAHQQHTLGDAGPQIQVPLGLLEEGDNLPQLLLLLVRPGHVGEADLVLAVGSVADAGPSEAPALVHAAAPALGPDHHKLPHQEDGADDRHIEQDLHPPGGHIGGGVVVVGQDAHTFLLLNEGPQLGPEQVRAAQLVVDRGAVLQVQVQVVSIPDGEAGHLPLLKQGLHLGKGDRGGSCGPVEEVVGRQQQHDQREIDAHSGASDLFQTGSLLFTGGERAARPYSPW